jgi:hypothetical protein
MVSHAAFAAAFLVGRATQHPPAANTKPNTSTVFRDAAGAARNIARKREFPSVFPRVPHSQRSFNATQYRSLFIKPHGSRVHGGNRRTHKSAANSRVALAAHDFSFRKRNAQQ